MRINIHRDIECEFFAQYGKTKNRYPHHDTGLVKHSNAF